MSRDAESSSALDSLRRDGWCALHGVIAPDAATAARHELWRVAVTCGVIAQSYNPNLPTIPFYTRVSVIKDSPRVAPLLADPRVLAIVRAALGAPADLCVTATTMVIHEPGTPRGEWHADEPFDATSTSVSPHVTVVWMMTPFTKDNGGYLILPESHRTSDQPGANDTRSKSNEFASTGQPGSVLITDSRLRRAVAANDDDLMRLSVVIGYAAKPSSGAPPRAEKSMLARNAFDRLPSDVKPMVAHWVA